MNYYIITGASRGLGEAIAINLLGKGNYVIGISRKKSDKLIELSKSKEYNLAYYECDLNRVHELEEVLLKVLEKIEWSNIESICLINNAGIVNPIKSIDKCKSEEIIRNFNVNTIAPIIITSKFIEKVSNYNIEKRVINISSGAGKKPYDGWSCYCSAKAAIDMFTKCVAVEQASRQHPVKILSFAPGIIDTDMQNEIRCADSENFSQLDRFINFKESNILMSPQFVAEKVIELLMDENFMQGGIIDISDKLK